MDNNDDDDNEDDDNDDNGDDNEDRVTNKTPACGARGPRSTPTRGFPLRLAQPAFGSRYQQKLVE